MFSPVHKRNQSEEGFTLVELLVVIIIIGILAAIAIPVFLNQRQRANDADLKQSMRNIAQAYTEWTIQPGNSNEVFFSHTNRHVANVIGDGQTLSPVSATAFLLEDLPGISPISVKDKTYFEIVVVNNPIASTWNQKHDEDEFCIIGRMENSNYDHITGAGLTAANFDRLLFWDSSLGGLKEMKDLVAAIQEGKELSCYVHPRQYMDARGIS